MEVLPQAFTFEQIHIEIARNATDDFNPFHDKNKWQGIRNNPFDGPIVLGFQLEALVENRLRHFRERQDECEMADHYGLRYSHYEFTFANAVTPGQHCVLGIKDSRFKSGANAMLTNRVFIRSGGSVALVGHKRESKLPAWQMTPVLPKPIDLAKVEDRAYLPGTAFFLKRKFMNTSDAKNFLTGSLVEQAEYFDELEDRVHFPEIFPCSFISCALLEFALKQGHDFEQNPMVYTAHRICVDKRHANTLKSNDLLNILVRQRAIPAHSKYKPGAISYECYGLLAEDIVLFAAIIDLLPLASITGAARTGGSN